MNMCHLPFTALKGVWSQTPIFTASCRPMFRMTKSCPAIRPFSLRIRTDLPASIGHKPHDVFPQREPGILQRDSRYGPTVQSLAHPPRSQPSNGSSSSDCQIRRISAILPTAKPASGAVTESYVHWIVRASDIRPHASRHSSPLDRPDIRSSFITCDTCWIITVMG